MTTSLLKLNSADREFSSYSALEEDNITLSIPAGISLLLPRKNTERNLSQRSSSNGDGIIDGACSSAEHLHDFATVGLGQSTNDPSTTIALDFCKKYIVKPYNILLIVIGWRRLRSRYDYFPWYKKLYNYTYPVFIFSMLLFTIICQSATCFSRSNSMGPQPTAGEEYILRCNDHIFFTASVITSFIMLCAFFVGIYIFRWTEPENISSLAETVFLSYNKTSIQKSRKRPVLVLLFFIVLGIIWFFSSSGINILRIYVLEFRHNTVVSWFIKNRTANDFTEANISFISNLTDHEYTILHYTLTISALFGFTFIDLLYIAIVLNYCFQCQLLSFYIRNIVDKVHSRSYSTLSEACKDIYRVFEFLKILNGWLSQVTSLAIFIFIVGIIDSYKSLDNTIGKENVSLGFLNLFQWITAAAFPIIMAVHFTRAGKRLMRLGLAIAQRPYNYSSVPEIELQFFLNYVNSTNYSARLMFIPMYPSLVGGAMFIVLLLIALGTIVPHFGSPIRWF